MFDILLVLVSQCTKYVNVNLIRPLLAVLNFSKKLYTRAIKTFNKYSFYSCV